VCHHFDKVIQLLGHYFADIIEIEDASKKSVRVHHRQPANATARLGIAATAVCPAFVRTPLAEQQVADRGLDAVIERHAVKRLLEPSEVADLVAFLLGPSGRGITGVPVPVDLGWTAA